LDREVIYNVKSLRSLLFPVCFVLLETTRSCRRTVSVRLWSR